MNGGCGFIIDLIDGRREKLTLSRSTYRTLIVCHWIASGSPPVNHAEKAFFTELCG